MKRATILSLALILAAAGCTAAGEEVNPVAGDAGDTGHTHTNSGTGAGGTGGTGGSPPDAGPPKRTVMQRNPFGNVAETENLLWDGDFEWYSPFSDQYGWLAGSNVNLLGFGFSDVRMGSVCHSGIKCAGLKKKRLIAGIGVASMGNKIEASFWAKFILGSCDQVSASLIAYDNSSDPDVVIKPTSEMPDANGWCFYDNVLDARSGKPILVIQNTSEFDVVIDDAVVKKVSPAMSVKAYHGPPSPELSAELDAARESLRRVLRGPHDPPPNAARRAFEGRKGRHP